jgi:hypothetical protein
LHFESSLTKNKEFIEQTRLMLFGNQGQHPERTPIVGLIVNKIVTPYVIASLGPKAYATAVVQP